MSDEDDENKSNQQAETDAATMPPAGAMDEITDADPGKLEEATLLSPPQSPLNALSSVPTKLEEPLLARIRGDDPALRVLHLNNLELENSDLLHLATAMRTNDHIREVHLQQNRLSEIPNEIIRHRQKVDLSHNELLEVSISLRESPTLDEVDLSHNSIGSVQQFYGGPIHGTLRRLNLSYNPLREQDIEVLAGVFWKSGMQVLQLAGNNMKGARLEAFLQTFLGSVSTKQHDRNGFHQKLLDLSDTPMGTKDAKLLAAALAKPLFRLTGLGLSNNNLDDACAVCLALGLEKNVWLRELDLSRNQISPSSAEKFFEILEDHPFLAEIELRENPCEAIARPAWLRGRNLELYVKEKECETRGALVFAELVDGNKIQWKSDFVALLKVDQDREWSLIHQALQRSSDQLFRVEAGDSLPPAAQTKTLLKDLVNQRIDELGCLLHHCLSSTHSKAFNLAKFLVYSLEADIDSTVGDEKTPRDIAMTNSTDADVRKWATTIGRSLNRYTVVQEPNQQMVFKSASHTIESVVDNGTKDTILLVKMKNKRDFLRELACQLKSLNISSGKDLTAEQLRFDPQYVLPVIRHHDEVDRSGRLWCLVVPRYDRTVKQILQSEFIAGRNVDQIIWVAKSLAQAIKHISDKRIVHCNISPSCIVRHEGQIKVMGFDLAVGVGRPVVLNRTVSSYSPPELARALLSSDDKTELEKQIADLTLEQRRLQEIESDQNTERLQNVLSRLVRLKKRLELCQDDQRHQPPAASTRIDVWSFGVVLYELLTGERLFPGNCEDVLSDPDACVELATWQGISDVQLDRVFSSAPDIPWATRNRAKDLLVRCLSADERPESMDEILEHRFLVNAPPSREDDFVVVAPNRVATSVQDNAYGVSVPTAFMILPFELELKDDTLIPPSDSKPYLEALVQMQEFNAMQQLLKAKASIDEEQAKGFLAELQSLHPLEAAELVLRFMDINESSLQHFLVRIQDPGSFRENPTVFLEEKSGEAFHRWWSFYKDRVAYFYIIDEYYQRPVVSGMYPVELKANASALQDLMPFFCLSLTSVNVLMSIANLASTTTVTSLPSRLKERALLQLDRLNQKTTLADYLALCQAFEKLGGFIEEKDEEKDEEFGSVNELLLSKLESFYSLHDPIREFGGLGRVLDRDGIVRWTSPTGQKEMQSIQTMSIAEHLSRKRQLEEALQNVEQKLKLTELTGLQTARELDVLRQDKQILLENKEKLENYISDQRAANQECCIVM